MITVRKATHQTHKLTSCLSLVPLIYALAAIAFLLNCTCQAEVENIRQEEIIAELQNKQIVLWAYNTVLQRDPDEEGLQHHVNLLNTNQLSKDQLVQSLRNSSEYQANKQEEILHRNTLRLIIILSIAFFVFFAWSRNRDFYAHHKTALPYITLVAAFGLYGLQMPTIADDLNHLRELSEGTLTTWITTLYTQWTSRLLIESILSLILHWGGFLAFQLINVLVPIALAYSLSILSGINRTKYGTWSVISFIALYPIMHMGTAGWATTMTNYFWPLAFGLVALVPVQKIITKQSIRYWQHIVFTLATLYAANQEQSALILTTVYVSLTCWLIIKKQLKVYAVVQTILCMASLLFHLIAPGNHSRYQCELQTWFPDYAMLSFMNKLEIGISSTLSEFFFRPNLVFLVFLAILVLLVFYRTKSWTYRMIAIYPLSLNLIVGVGMLQTCFSDLDNLLQSEKAISALGQYGTIHIGNAGLTTAFLPLILMGLGTIAIAISLILIYREKPQEWLLAFTALGLGLATRMAVAFSPTIWASGARTFVYLYFAFILISLRLLCQLATENPKAFRTLLPVLSWTALLAFLSNLLSIQ